MRRVIGSTAVAVLLMLFNSPAGGVEKVTEDSLIKQLESAKTDPERIAVIGKLGPVGTIKSVRKLVVILKNGESSILRRTAASAIGEIGLKNSELSRRALEESYKTDDKYVRIEAMKALSKIGSSNSVPLFLNGYRSNTSREIKYWAVIGLSRNGSKKYRKLYMDAIGKTWDKQGAREAAIIALGRFGLKPDWRIIRPYSRSNDASVVIASMKAAGYLQNLDSLYINEKNLSHKDPRVAEAALDALGFFDGKRAIPLLIRFKAADPQNALSGKIKTVLKKLGASKRYAILKTNMVLRVKPTERSNKKKIISKRNIVTILGREKRRYIITDSTGDIEDYWYRVKDMEGHTGYLFGGYLTIVNSYQ